jgi:hypothetical protein
LSAVNIKKLIVSANQVDATNLLHACFQFVRENLREVLADTDFLALGSENPELWGKLLVVLALPGQQATGRKQARES